MSAVLDDVRNAKIEMESHVEVARARLLSMLASGRSIALLEAANSLENQGLPVRAVSRAFNGLLAENKIFVTDADELQKR